jgi:hypothetical protein
LEAVTQALQHTPWWVFVLFVFIVSRGVAALRAQTVPIARLALIPAIFAVWGVYNLFQLFGFNLAALGAFAAALLIGAGVGAILSRHGSVRADHAKGLVEISGSPVTLVLVLAIFISKYALGYWQGVDRNARTSVGFLAADAIVSGFVIGMFVGRLAGLWLRYKTAPETMLDAG